MINKKAFTLAEVLITLTIIGVIAALTIPNLMQSYKKHQVEVGVKEAYSILSNAMKMSVAENGDTDDWIYIGGSDFAKKYVMPYLKINSICNEKIPCFDNNGWNKADGTRISGNNGGYGPSMFYKVKLSNNMHLGVWAPQSRAGYGSVSIVCFLVDIDGGHGKSVLGRDVFAFPYADYATSRYYNSYKPGTFFGEGDCIGQPSEFNYARLIMKNGWKIPDDYPVKKF